MRVHHINCGTMCPPARVVGTMICHCLVIEGADGLTLVDTGLGTADLATPRARLGRTFLFLTGPRLDEAEPAVAQLGRLGFAARDVRHIVLTHLDLDHAGGLSDFPDADVHVAVSELEAAQARRTLNERNRYRPVQWAHRPRWRTHEAGGEAWHGFEGVRALDGLPPEILLVPLGGHTRGHHGVAVRGGDGWMLHCGDAYFAGGEMAAAPSCPVGLRFFQRVVAIDNEARLANQARLRMLANDRSAGVRVFCAHDVDELARRQQAAASPERDAVGRA